MKLITGIGYDSRHPNQRTSELCSLTCGEIGLVQELAFRAGLPPKKDNKASRVIHYLNALQSADNKQRFYNSSLETDPIATAETLLEWRDWAVFHGWQHETSSQKPDRLYDLNAVETHFDTTTLSIGEQIYQIMDRLHFVASTVNEVCLHSPLCAWPPLYQKLFLQMEEIGICFSEDIVYPKGRADSDSDLGKLQHALFHGNTDPITFHHDDSVKLFTASDSTLIAQYVALNSTADNLIIAQCNLHCIEQAVCGGGSHSAGLGSSSVFRAPNLLLQLMLQCSWHTPSADVILQYLTLPAGKFRQLRQRLAFQFKDLPGYHLEGWQSTIDEFIQAKLADAPDANETELRQSIHDWLPLCLSEDNRSMSVEQAIVIAKRCTDYWQHRIVHADDNESKSIFGAAYAAADATHQALQRWPDPSIDPIQLNRLTNIIQELGGSRWQKPRYVQTADIIECVETSGLRQNPVNDLVWVDPQLTSLHKIPSFSQDELTGIPLAPSVDQQAAIQQEALKRAYLPILLAGKSITLIACNHEPDLLKLTLSGLCEITEWPRLEEITLSGDIASANLVSEISLPSATRRWKANITLPFPRPTESFSSLNSLALKPHEYVLRYSAKLSEGSIGAVAVDARLKGNLAHRLIERWFIDNHWGGHAIERSAIDSWLQATLQVMIREFALPLAQAGSDIERIGFQQQMLDALDSLLNILHIAGAGNVQTEAQLHYTDSLGQLEGTLDIICTIPGGKLVIIDLKWGSYNRYRDELRKSRPLQLATYMHIADGIHPDQIIDAGYFIISKAELLCNSNIAFPTATAIEQDQPISFAECWGQLAKTIQWRASQLATGSIEVSYGVMPPDDHSAPPTDCLPLIEMEDAANRMKKNSYRQAFKPVDPWRNLTGNMKE